MIIEDKKITLDEAYNIEEYQNLFKKEALEFYGFHIQNQDAFIDELINNKFDDEGFLNEFLKSFKDNIIFDSHNNDRYYFDFIFNAISDVSVEKDNLEVKKIIKAI